MLMIDGPGPIWPGLRWPPRTRYGTRRQPARAARSAGRGAPLAGGLVLRDAA
jgi:hypothetical protein